MSHVACHASLSRTVYDVSMTNTAITDCKTDITDCKTDVTDCKTDVTEAATTVAEAEDDKDDDVENLGLEALMRYGVTKSDYELVKSYFEQESQKQPLDASHVHEVKHDLGAHVHDLREPNTCKHLNGARVIHVHHKNCPKAASNKSKDKAETRHPDEKSGESATSQTKKHGDETQKGPVDGAAEKKKGDSLPSDSLPSRERGRAERKKQPDLRRGAKYRPQSRNQRIKFFNIGDKLAWYPTIKVCPNKERARGPQRPPTDMDRGPQRPPPDRPRSVTELAKARYCCSEQSLGINPMFLM